MHLLKFQTTSLTARNVFFILFSLGIFLYFQGLFSPLYLDDKEIFGVIAPTFFMSTIDPSKVFHYWPTRFIPCYSFSLNYYLFANNIFYFHLFNLLLHIASSFLVFLISRELIKKTDTTIDINLFSFCVSFLFLCHPLQSQATVYIWQRIELFAGFFELLTIFLFILTLIKSSRTTYFFAILSMIFGVLSKETVAVVPFILTYIMLVFFPEKNKKINYLAPFFGILAYYPILLLFKGREALVHSSEVWGDHRLNVIEYFLTQANVIFTYLRLYLFPLNQVFEYDYPLTMELTLTTFFKAIILILLFILSFTLRKKLKIVAFGLFIFFINLSITSTFIPIIDVIWEHRMYSSLFGLNLVFIFILFKFCPNKMNVFLPLLIFIFLVLTYQRVSLWANEELFMKDNLAKAPHKQRLATSLAYYYFDNNKIKESEEILQHLAKHYNKTKYFFQANIKLGEIYFNI
ncbi:MAG: hypothetical protein HQK84_07880, partial [Nitrospinae bacterium]|nr:hypothetical protein [Nitrospinota bacterium]